MPVKRFVHKFFRYFGLKLERTVSSFRNQLAHYNIHKSEYGMSGNKIYFKKLCLEIPISAAAPILERYQNALKLEEKGGFKFFLNSDSHLHAKNNKVEFSINDDEELFILSEVFLEGAYNLIPSTKKKIALIDVGMNVGITSLFYASKENVEKVFSFEPFEPTFSMALKNIQINPGFGGKIQACNFGLAKKQADILVPYSSKEKGRMGTKGLPKSEGYIATNVSSQLMHLKSASDEFLKIKELVKDHFVVCKIDTEGAEYEIIDSLYNANLLSIADVYFIEWHEIKPTDIIAKFTDTNYNVIETASSLLHSGMIYAIKNNG
ncbi:MAG: FkbM family methyltransferase [Ginsengibacter sp.]